MQAQGARPLQNFFAPDMTIAAEFGIRQIDQNEYVNDFEHVMGAGDMKRPTSTFAARGLQEREIAQFARHPPLPSQVKSRPFLGLPEPSRAYCAHLEEIVANYSEIAR